MSDKTKPSKFKKAIQDVQDIREFSEAEQLAPDPFLDVLQQIHMKLCAIHEQMKTEVVTRDKFR